MKKNPNESIDLIESCFNENAQTNFNLLTKEEIQKKIKPREKFSHKGT